MTPIDFGIIRSKSWRFCGEK